jgi:hypothetical protein
MGKAVVRPAVRRNDFLISLGITKTGPDEANIALRDGDCGGMVVCLYKPSYSRHPALITSSPAQSSSPSPPDREPLYTPPGHYKPNTLTPHNISPCDREICFY